MIPILYESTETAFITNGLGRLPDCIECVVTEERNGIFECDFQYPVTGVNYDKIQLGRIIAVTHSDNGDIQPFDIISCSRPIDGVVEFHCQHISYRQSGLTVYGTNINTLADALNRIKNYSNPVNPFTYSTDKTSGGFVAAFDGVPRSVRSILGGVEGSILDSYGGEFEWDVWKVKLWKQRGEIRPLTIRYGVNLSDYKEDLDYSESYSAVIPYWQGDNGDGTDTVVIASKVSANSLLFNRETCIPLDLSDKFEDKPTTTELRDMAAAILSTNNPVLPAQSIEVNFVRLQDTTEYQNYQGLLTCNLCDQIKVEFPRYNVSGWFKIVRIEYNVLVNRYDSMELGTLSTNLSEALGLSNGLDSGNLDHSTPSTGSMYVVEDGTTSNSWDYRLWSDGTYEAWRSANFTGITVTSSSAGTYYGTGGEKSLGVPTFPNNSNTGIKSAEATENGGSHSSGVYVYGVNTSGATGPNSSFIVIFRAHASTSNGNCGVDLYIRGTYS